MSGARYIVGDVRDVLATIPDGSVDLVLTSPPFLALRSYLPADHPDKHREIGSEPDPATFLDTLLLLTAEWGRVLAPHGSICVELGDTYAGGSAEGSDTRNVESARFRGLADGVLSPKAGTAWPLPKSLCGIPHLYHLSLAYGRNLLTGEESPAGRWRVRNVVAWCRPNPPVGALGDKFRPATSYMTIATRETKRYFDLDAVRTEFTGVNAEKQKDGWQVTENAKDARTSGHMGTSSADVGIRAYGHPAGAPPLDYWVIPTAPYSGSHYAVYPPALCERPIKSMVPAKVCTVCGAPSERIVELEPGAGGLHHANSGGSQTVGGHPNGHRSQMGERRATTIGWTDCGHDSWRNGVVLDPFAGSGTTLMVATGHGRDAIGCDIDARNADLALDRVGPLLLTVEHLADEVAS